ncbi:hypothetical protein P9J86_06955 [Glaesserella parasuis]|uniref:hypothetical protein n=1 Tax=Glaesserella parasuis TaxID=738 RepID=UPI0024372D77|nr:hypothetical protein [Glaesserella parasuis]MDG6261629.1 hypothetical protein [Glaesserella parasuis]MDG6323050.1 hypothetical protein [Glaesserella parasuis]
MNRYDFAELAAREMQGCEEYQARSYSYFPSSLSREEYEMTLKELWNDENSDYFQ